VGNEHNAPTILSRRLIAELTDQPAGTLRPQLLPSASWVINDYSNRHQISKYYCPVHLGLVGRLGVMTLKTTRLRVTAGVVVSKPASGARDWGLILLLRVGNSEAAEVPAFTVPKFRVCWGWAIVKAEQRGRGRGRGEVSGGEGTGWGLGEGYGRGREGRGQCARPLSCAVGFIGADYSMQRGGRGRDGERWRKGQGETREKRRERGQTAEGMRENDGSA
jgi:hypothetical protein